MRIASFQWKGRRHVGLVSADGGHISPIPLGAGEAQAGALALIESLAAGQPMPAGGEPVPLADVRLEAPIPRPRRNIFCVGRNYHAHARELSGSIFKDQPPPADMPWPIVFTKVPETVIGTGDEVHLPTGISEQIDYEAELAVVIGRGGKNIARAEAMQHVFGYTIVNDVTARDVQTRHAQWHLGKSFDTFCPMGPWIVTADELDGRNTRLRLWVNEELRQDARTSELIFDIPTLIETCSRGITLHPGDVIATGTPAGVAMGMKPPRYLKSGDLVRIEIDGIGTLSNRFV